MSPIGSDVVILGPQVVCCLGSIRRCGPAGGRVSLGVGSEVENAHTIPTSLSASYFQLKM